MLASILSERLFDRAEIRSQNEKIITDWKYIENTRIMYVDETEEIMLSLAENSNFHVVHVFFHGNAHSIFSSLPRIREIFSTISTDIQQNGENYPIQDVPGVSFRKISYEYPTIFDEQAASSLTLEKIRYWAHTVAKDLEEKKRHMPATSLFIFHGYSIGTGFALSVLSENPDLAHACILEAPFYNLRSLIYNSAPWFSKRLIDMLWTERFEYFPTHLVLQSSLLEGKSTILVCSPVDEICGYAFNMFASISGQFKIVPVPFKHKDFMQEEGTLKATHIIIHLIRKMRGTSNAC